MWPLRDVVSTASPEGPSPTLELGLQRDPYIGMGEKEKMENIQHICCSTYNVSKTSGVLKVRVPRWCFLFLSPQTPLNGAPLLVLTSGRICLAEGDLRLTVDLWPSLSVLVCSGASGRVRWCFRWGLWLMAVALVALQLHHFIQQFLYCH